MPEVAQAVVAGPRPGDWEKALNLLEQAVRVGSRDPAAAYLLATCYKRLGRLADARNTLAKIAEPDANVFLQRGLLAHADKDFAAAEKDFARSWEMEPTSFAAGYNLLLAKLCQQNRSELGPLFDRLLPLAGSANDQHFLNLFRALLAGEASQSSGLNWDMQQGLAKMSAEDEARIVGMLAGLGQLDLARTILQVLTQIRPQSAFAWQSFCQISMVQAREAMERCRWKDAQAVLDPLTRLLGKGDALINTPGSPARMDVSSRIALFNMLGTCACMMQDYDPAIAYFRSALDLYQKTPEANQRGPAGGSRANPRQPNARGVGQQALLEQNLALAYEWQGKWEKAEAHWNRYFDQLEYNLADARPGDYPANLAFEGLNRLAEMCTQKERWNSALGFLLRAHKFRPSDADVLERLFHLYEQLRKPEEARKILQRLREVRPNDAQVEMFELNTRDIRDVEELSAVLNDVRRLAQKNAGNAQFDDRVNSMVNNLIPTMERMFDQWTGQVNKVLDQMRRLPSYQINWTMVREVMHDLNDKFYQLRKLAVKTQSMVQGNVRRELQRLAGQCDRKIDQCRSLSE